MSGCFFSNTRCTAPMLLSLWIYLLNSVDKGQKSALQDNVIVIGPLYARVGTH